MLLLHGITDDAQPSHRWSWPAQIDKSMAASHLSVRVPQDRVIAPDYRRALVRKAGLSGTPRTLPRTARPVDTDIRNAEQRRLQSILGKHRPSYLSPRRAVDSVLVTGARRAAVGKYSQLGVWTSSARVRADVVHQVLQVLPEAGEVVVVAHSLGSMVAIELLPYLPTGLAVARLITLGSPATQRTFRELYPPSDLRLRSHLVRSWANFWSTGDPACGGRGLSGIFPGVLDLKIRMPLPRHSALDYLGRPVVGKAIGDALKGADGRLSRAQ